MPHTMNLHEAFSTAIAAWRTGRQPSLQLISQLIDAGYDVDAIAHRHSFKALPAPSGVKDVTQNALTEATPFSLEVQVIEGEPRVLDTDLGEAPAAAPSLEQMMSAMAPVLSASIAEAMKAVLQAA